ncbi:nucleoside triphosphate pyrophosphohydrolase family protein [Sphaerothrix gracilis]|uniref:nucleoside triphosphate pyrophosphohydrolase family protein n=1 Tax=Sphaerothrix gracilis TaxID=3151835 RepID=UPI0031FCF20E
MELDDYQNQSSLTDQFPDIDDDGASLTIPILGLIGELGSLVTCFKKRIRDGESYEHFIKDLREEIGDVLWYLTNLASKWELSLNEIARENLDKNKDRWLRNTVTEGEYTLYDEGCSEEEKIPRKFNVYFTIKEEANVADIFMIGENGQREKLGDTLSDNSYKNDLYRFHDIFHLAYAAILGWSPVLRQLLNIKRKSNAQIDEIEDGARARITEEAISLYVFNYANRHNMLASLKEIDLDVLLTIKNLVSDLEVKDKTMYEWKLAILSGYEIYRQLYQNRGGVVEIDLLERKIFYRGTTENYVSSTRF